MSMAIIGISSAVLTIAGTAVTVSGQLTAAKNAEYLAEHNAKVDQMAAANEMNVAGENARRKTRENARIIGLQKAALAQSGLAPTGTPLAVLGETVLTLQRDVLDIGYEAAARATALQSSAEMALYEGKVTAGALRTQALASGISGVASAASGYFKATGG
jgi:hypothetical protein